jgi:TonB family protein
VISLVVVTSAGSGLALEPNPYIGQLPPGSVTIPDKEGHYVKCRPPEHYTGPNFKALCKQFLLEYKLARIGMPDPKYPVSSWIGPSDYPHELLGSGKQGLSVIQVALGPTGAVTDCVVVATSGTLELDQAVCNAARQKGRFLPRIGPDGKPGDSKYEFSINWTPM